jgi:hypothetical protein
MAAVAALMSWRVTTRIDLGQGKFGARLMRINSTPFWLDNDGLAR